VIAVEEILETFHDALLPTLYYEPSPSFQHIKSAL
jgi:hypothetical protein